MTRYQHAITGCKPAPLAHYLKALGLLRLVAEQADASVRGWWHNETFWLETTLDQQGLEAFLLHDYAPVPAVAPWNGGSGFADKDNQVAISAIEESACPRLAAYRQAIEVGKRLRAELGISDLAIKEQKERKPLLMQRCRDEMPEAALIWLDAAYVLAGTDPKYPPLLGTGGNDGRLDFTNNFMQRLLELFDHATGVATTAAHPWLRHALWSSVTAGLAADKAIGQFFPGSAGGPNQTTGFDAKSLINPWDFVLMIEGSVVFAGAAVKRLGSEEHVGLAYPFAVRPTAAGYSSAADGDKARNELWLPLWFQPLGFEELRSVFSEGRVRVGRRPARTGVDFARAAASLGLARGLGGFERIGFQERNGQATFAVPLGRITVAERPRADLLQPIDEWLRRFLDSANSDKAPAAVARAARKLEHAIFDLCETGNREATQRVWLALAETEATAARRPAWFNEKWLRPLPPLGPEWLERCDDGSVEFQLALALASIYDAGVGGMRQHLAPLEPGNHPHRFSELREPAHLWNPGTLVQNLVSIARWRLQKGTKLGIAGFAATGRQQASLAAVSAFLAGEVNDARLEAWMRAAVLLDWTQVARNEPVSHDARVLPEAPYALMKLCHLSHPLREGQRITAEPAILARLHAGDGPGALLAASRRLRANGWTPALASAALSPSQAHRLAAATLIPLTYRDTHTLVNLVTRPEKSTVTHA